MLRGARLVARLASAARSIRAPPRSSVGGAASSYSRTNIHNDRPPRVVAAFASLHHPRATASPSSRGPGLGLPPHARTRRLAPPRGASRPMPSTSAAGDGDARGPTARASSSSSHPPSSPTSSSAQKGVIPVPPRGSVTTVFAVTKPELLTDPVVQALKASVEAASSNGRSFRLHLGCALEDFPSDALADPGSGSGDDPAAVLWWFGDAKVLDRILLEPVGSRVAWIHSGSAGVEHILAGAPTVMTHPAPLTNARGAFSSSLGEWALFGMMWFAKKVARMRDAHREGRWMRESVGVLSGKTCAIVGYGDIGRAVAVRAKAFGMRVVALRRNPERYKEGDEMVDEMAALGEMRRVATEGDFVVLALPHTRETEGMFSRDVVAAMKPNATLVNVGRGAVVDEEALIEALREGRIKGAALDVTATEPLPEGHALYDLEEKALLSFHCADLTEDYYELSFATFEKHLEAYAGGKDGKDGRAKEEAPVWNLVDKSAGY